MAVFRIQFDSRAWAAASGQQWGARDLPPFFLLLEEAAVGGMYEVWS